MIVEDINDNFPEIHFSEDKNVIKIKEETFATLFTTPELYIEDIDLAAHATYSVKLIERNDAKTKYAEAFSIVPTNGYQLQNFTIAVVDTTLVDYENVYWRDGFEILVRYFYEII